MIYNSVWCSHLTFCFKDAATTESNTYGHTLSLHDALPISASGHRPSAGGAAASGAGAARRPALGLHRWHCAVPRPPTEKIEVTTCDERSEEHTSELQSLMRILYADFCLKNKISKHRNNCEAIPLRTHTTTTDITHFN